MLDGAACDMRMRTLIQDTRWRRSGLGGLLALGALTIPARGQSAIVYTIDGKSLTDAVVSFAIPNEVTLVRERENSTIKWYDVDRLDLNARGEAVAGPWSVICSDGSVLLGHITGGGENAVRIEHAALGARSIALEYVDSLDRRGAPGEAIEAGRSDGGRDRAEDRIILTNGDIVKGSIARLTSEGVALLVSERERLVAWSVIRRVSLAALQSGPASGKRETSGGIAERPGALVWLVDGSMLVARRAVLRDGSVQVETALGQTMAAPREAVRTIESTGGRRVWLSEVPLTSARAIRYFDHSMPPASPVPGNIESIKLGGITHSRGLRFAGAGHRSWNLQGQFAFLRASLGMEDGAGPLADADVVIRVDGRPVIEHRGLRSDQPARPVEVNLAGAKELEIEVGFGRRGPVQDCVVLVNPALIKPQ